MEDDTEHWRVGHKCLAPYSGDGTYYRACIRSLSGPSAGRRTASVRFSGFTEEEDEIVDVRRLRKRPERVRPVRAGSVTDSGAGSSDSVARPSITSPLKYITEEERLRAKYADLFDDDDGREGPVAKSSKSRDWSVSPGTPSSSSPSSASSSSRAVSRSNFKRKKPVAVGGEVKTLSEDVTPPKRSPASSNVPPSMPAGQPRETDSFGFLEGFSCEEMEKPYFPGVSNASPKVPLVLSQDESGSVVQVPATVNRYLRDYQREGVKFLYRQYQKGEGGILGDDMGLGKTVQVLAFLCAVLGKTGTREDCQRRLPEFLQKKLKTPLGQSTEVFLIICPNSVMYNWLDEFETWTYCTVGKYHGRERQETLWKAMKGKLDAVVTSYETYRIYMDSLLKIQWAGVIVDEVHKIKESGSQITQALKEVNTKRRYGLTGTALQNKLSELWCVLDWANPGCLGCLAKFKLNFEEAISRGQKFHASKRELAESRKVSSKFAALRDQWMIRRTKALISHQLPTKEEKVVFCKLSKLQLSIYQALLESDDVQLILKQKDPCDCGSGSVRLRCCYKCNSDGESVKALTMTFMSLLIKVANHAALLTPDAGASDAQRRRARRYCDVAFARHPQFVALSRAARFCTLSDPSYCGKMQILEKLLKVFKHESSKVLLFSYYTQLLNIIEMYLKTTEYVYRRLDGKTPAQDRQRFVHEFNTDRDIFLFLISTKAGGLGLNLTGANVVVIFDPNWNPTYDLQAQDRAYRIGQHRDVRVYRLVSAGCIEENMYLRQVYKQQLASAAVTSENPVRYFTAVAGDARQQGELFGLHNMFALRADTSCLTKDLIQRRVKTEQGITMAKYVSPPATETDTEQTFNEEEELSSDSDGDTECSQSEDDHGVASQFLDDDPQTLGRDPAGHTRNTAETSAVRASGTREDPAPTAFESDEGAALDRRAVRGKATLRGDGRIERRVKAVAAGRPSTSAAGAKGRGRPAAGSEVAASGQGGGRAAGNRRRAAERSMRPPGAVDDVFRECGVAFIHSNLKIVGGSRVEDHVTNIAVRDVYDLGRNSQQPANYNVPTLQESVSQDKDSVQSQEPLPASLLAQSQRASHRIDGTTVLFGQTPRGIQRRHFASMAETLKHPSVRDFARHILSLPLEQYASLLGGYYASKHPELGLAQLYRPAEPEADGLTDAPAQERSAGRVKSAGGARASRKRITRTRAPSGVGKFESPSEDEEFGGGDGDVDRAERVETDRSLDYGRDNSPKMLGAYRASRTARTKRGSRTRAKSTGQRRETVCKPRMQKSAVAGGPHRRPRRHVSDSDDEAWPQDDQNRDEETDRSLGRRQPSVPVGHGTPRASDDGLRECAAGSSELDSSPAAVPKEDGMSFLDDIFFTKRSEEPPKPPPKRKSPRMPLAKRTVVRGDLTDSDAEMEDLTDGKLTGIDSVGTDGPSVIGGGALWKRNANFGSRPSALEQASAEAQLEGQSVFEKYAESFAPNEHFLKRGVDSQRRVYVEDTVSPEDGSSGSGLRPSTSIVAETDSFS